MKVHTNRLVCNWWKAVRRAGKKSLARARPLMEGAFSAKFGFRTLRAVRPVILLLVSLHVGLFVMSMIMTAALIEAGCSQTFVVATSAIATGAGVRLIWFVGTGMSQAATAATMTAEGRDSMFSSILQGKGFTRTERRMWYKRWLWWGRFGALIALVQLLGATYLTYLAVESVSRRRSKSPSLSCFKGGGGHLVALSRNVLITLPVAAWALAFAQCYVGSDVLSWRSLYEMHNEAWKAHYREIFDHGIREFLCCIGRSKYLSTLDEDEVGSVAALLGDLVAYRAAGASHLEFLAGIALLREQQPKSRLSDHFPQAPDSLIREATILHPYAVAAYTGPLLDIGRNPLFFPCAWVYRQGVLTPWSRSRRPILEGDNWWRGHAAAFLKGAQLPPEALHKGRVHQKNREAVYFVIVLQHLRCVLVTVRGTETPEDLLTDGLCRECKLSDSDLSAFLKGDLLSETEKHNFFATMPHFGHAGVVEAARELAFQLDNVGGGEVLNTSNSRSHPLNGYYEPLKQEEGFLSSLLGLGGECEGYALRFVGHSLGGAIAALTAMRLFDRYPSLHVYAYGVLPCLDNITAQACSSFVTSIIYNDEFSSRLSVASILRLRTEALRALAADSSTDSALITKLAKRLFGSEIAARFLNYPKNSNNVKQEYNKDGELQQHRRRHSEHKLTGNGNGNDSFHKEVEVLMTSVSDKQIKFDSAVLECAEDEDYHQQFDQKEEPLENCLAEASEDSNRLLSNGQHDDHQSMPLEMFVPGLVIHLICDEEESGWPSLLKMPFSSQQGGSRTLRAVLRHRESFKDLLISPSMFLDHMPWRCQRALNYCVQSMTELERGLRSDLDFV
ncbi:hypothetical protein O6H91_21G016100 [Diphasiastrum complanatum]|uniref:Uncharacterized protein n=1 Tax=Diphasiastrum complanatum TaxID=34168 RepID=A0ACC2AIA4_DIPCM|nr:hypothetical protein O6H91_21G016100 [Diphasiastrum complanatum]